MKTSIVPALIVSCMFAFGISSQAQEKPKPDTAKPPAEHTMTGCLQKGADPGTFIVNNTAEKGPKTIGIVESKDKLDAHVGHKIDITGTAVPAAEAEAMKMKPPKADHYMKLSAVKMVSATCP
jgi:hypothetical protein